MAPWRQDKGQLIFSEGFSQWESMQTFFKRGVGFRIWGLGFGVWRLGFGVWGLGFSGVMFRFFEA